MNLNLKESFERWCRLCAEEQEVTMMIYSAEAEAMLLQEKLNKYFLIEIDEDDNLPKNICIQCCTKLQTVCEFIDKVKKAQNKLINHCSVINIITNENQTSTQIKTEAEDVHENISNETLMEVSVDPMIVLQNSDDTLSPIPESYDNVEDVMHLNGVDGEDVTIKLIKRDDLSLKNHSWTHINDKTVKKYNCSSCLEGFDFKCDLIAHFKKHRTNGMCQICGRNFRTEKNLSIHMAAHISKANKYTCKICKRSYNTMSNLKTHSITHSNERPYNCHLCKKSFKRNQDLKFHLNQHTGAKPYKCPFCDKSFASSGNCYSHRHRMHPGKQIEGKEYKEPPPSLVTKPELQTAALKSPLTLINGVFKYQCQQCDHSFMKRDNYLYHMYQHTGEKPFQCTYCNETFVTRKGLLLHYDKIHPGRDRPLALLSRNALLK
ncbi:PREDICTED: zinc finger protein 391-like isoform X2 [Papilio polytes]|uniref:zinc finger protein 391-like isoform X2 n=1 Tax=Papilio polytes TaxID=76194 RepID=UPI0006766026|nr:PREDICTED: zinc finger protein 391-like isoform X2 [Papilio polytes]